MKCKDNGQDIIIAVERNKGYISTYKTCIFPDGIGLKSVMKTLSKYNGDYDWEYDENNKTFTATVMLCETTKK